MRSFLHRLKARLAHGIPILTLVGTVGLAAVVNGGDYGRGALTGFAEAAPEAIATLEAGRVSSIHFGIGSEVEPGQLIVTLDSSVVDGEIAIAKAEKARIEADVRAERVLLSHRLDVDREDLERAVRREREDILSLTAESQALDTEMGRVKKLVSEHHLVATDLTSMNVRRAQLASLTTEKPLTLHVLSKQLDAAAQRRNEVDAASSPLTAKLEADLIVVQRRIELLEQRRAGLFLRATGRGRVVSLEKHPGETAGVGEPIVKLVSPTQRVVVCVPERQSLGLREGDAARLWVRGQRGAPLDARIVVLGPIVSELPARCWLTPRLPMWGREITLSSDTPLDVVAGEAFDVVLDGTTAHSQATTAPIAEKSGSPSTQTQEPRLMTVPAELARRTRFEPSGILVRSDEHRYLVVSDDTGIKNADSDGRPWLFAMDGTGKVEPKPIPITGVSAIDDLESITAGSDGELYVLSSQSRSRKDRRKPARTALLRLRPEGAGFKVDGEVHLAENLELAPERARALGLPRGTSDLDIEGMTFRAGALYLGLKAPLDEQGEAMIWKIGAPKALFDGGASGASKLDGARVEPWGHARVDVEIDGKPIPGGISELMFASDDSLVLASTPSTADGAAGALWRVDHPRGSALVATLVRRFPGRKPEGLTPSLAAGKLMIVFDAGSRAPSFLETPWPP